MCLNFGLSSINYDFSEVAMSCTQRLCPQTINDTDEPWHPPHIVPKAATDLGGFGTWVASPDGRSAGRNANPWRHVKSDRSLPSGAQ